MTKPRRTLDPKLDVVFSMLFGAERNRDILLSLLNAVLTPPEPITEVEVLPERPERWEVESKGIVLDLRVRLANGEQVDVEMQSQHRPAGRERTLYYWARLYGGQLLRGNDYVSLRRCVVILIANFCFLVSPRFHSVFRPLEVTTGELLTRDLELHVLELPKLWAAVENEGRGAVLWGKFFLAETNADREQIAMNEAAVQRAMEALEVLSADPEARMIAERREAARFMYQVELTRGREEARSEGLAEGRSEGLAEGRSEGLAEGRSEGLAEGRSEGLAEGRSEGLAEGRSKGLAQAVLALLEARGVAVDAAARERIATCGDAMLLQRWLLKATTVDRAEKIFE